MWRRSSWSITGPWRQLAHVGEESKNEVRSKIWTLDGTRLAWTFQSRFLKLLLVSVANLGYSWALQFVSTVKVAEHSFQVLMPNSPLLLNYLCFGASFLQESRLTTEVFILAFWLGCVLLPWQRSLLKARLIKWLLFIYINSVVRLFSSFAHYEITLNPFCLHCSDKLLT